MRLVQYVSAITYNHLQKVRKSMHKAHTKLKRDFDSKTHVSMLLQQYCMVPTTIYFELQLISVKIVHIQDVLMHTFTF
jgi:hypothetical protein